ncbi:hypothetical protein TRAPUB_7887 [Trametes pubescens]|uniref:F-box domain-containing protein n=1 Tax=Trametes pubescens TaxID=154538 RepID=A0A1M2V219_TRAPU|nr:hypothetical protein TRAPUB_7887 [Trametes pubescens]
MTHRSVWTLLEHQSGGQPLLPRLQTLAVLNLDPHFVQPLVLLLTPSLHTLSLSFGDPACSTEWEVAPTATRPSGRISAFADVLLRITNASQLPLLSGLCIGDGGLPKDFPSSYFATLPQLSGLKTLDLLYSGAVIDLATLQLISNIPSLRSLSLEISLNGIGFRGTLQPGGGELQELHLSGSIDDLSHCFGAATLPNVVSLAVSVASVPNVGTLQDAFDLICSQVSRSVYEVNLFVKPHIPSPSVSLADILRPYLSFGDMNTMTVQFDEYVPLMDDQDALAFATAWPLLTHFSYSSYYADTPESLPTQMTVAGLLVFAQRCPELHIFDVPLLDVRVLPPPLSIPAVGQTALRYMQIPEYLGGDTANLLYLAVILDRLFPYYCACATPRSVTMQDNVVPFVLDCEHRYRPVRITDLLVKGMQAQRRLLEDDGTISE